jgi:hypothetical protein
MPRASISGAGMNSDLLLVIGLAIGTLAGLSVISGLLSGELRRGPSILLVAGAVVIALAWANKPGGYTLEEIPAVVWRTLGDAVR